MGSRVALALAAVVAGCSADIGGGGVEERAADGTPSAEDAASASDATPSGDARPPCVGGDAQADDGETCILYFATPATWDASRAACQAAGGDLAVIDDSGENLLLSTIPPADVLLPDIWVGGTDVGSEQVWHWLPGGTTFWDSGTTVTYAHWRLNEPNNSADEGCMVVEGDGTDPGGYLWDDRDCALSYSYFCEL